MKASVRLLIVAACVVMLAFLAGCNGQVPPSMREDATKASGTAAPAEQPAAEPAEAKSSPAPVASEQPAAEATASKPAESGEKRTQYEASLASAGVAVGAELQRTADGKVGGKLWTMSVDGKADASGKQPKVQLAAVGDGGAATVIAEITGDAGAVSVQGDTIVAVPAGTAKFVVTTTLSPSGKGGPELVVPLADVPTVPALTLVKPAE